MLKKIEALRFVQRQLTANTYRKKFLFKKQKVVNLQRWWKAVIFERKKDLYIKMSIKIQRFFRGYRIRKRLKTLVRAVRRLEMWFQKLLFRSRLSKSKWFSNIFFVRKHLPLA